MAHALDTLRITRKLESAGIDRRQAEAHAEALNEVVVTEYSELATKSDLERFPTREEFHEILRNVATKDDLAHFATNDDLAHYATKADLANLEKRMFRLWAASTVVLATLIVSMPFVAG